MKYKLFDKTAIEDEEGKMILRLLPVSCTVKRIREISKLLVKALNESTDEKIS